MALIDKERLVCVGRIIGAHGLTGELKILPITDVPEYYERHCPEVVLDTGKGLRTYEVRSIRAFNANWLVVLDGVNDRSAAESLKGAEVLLEREALKPLEHDEYFADDLIGCEVRTLAGERVGTVAGVMVTGANDVLEVTGGHGLVLVPLTGEVVKHVDPASRRIDIDPVPGLLEMNA